MIAETVEVKFDANTIGFVAGVRAVKAAIESLRAPIGDVSESLKAAFEAAGVTAALDKVRGFSQGTAEIGEQALTTSFALAASLQNFADLHGRVTPAGGSGADEASKDAEIFAAKERLKLQETKGDADAIAAIYDEWLAKVAAVYGKDSKQYYDSERQKVAAAQQAAEERFRIVEEEQRREAALYRKAAEEAARQWQDAARQISGRLGSLAVDVVDHTKAIGSAFRDLADSALKDLFKSAVGSFLGGEGGGGLSGLLFGAGGLAGLLGLGSGGLFGVVGDALGLGGAASTAADAAAMWGGGGEAEVLAGMGGAAGGSGLLGGLFHWLGGLLSFARGGVVPSAAGGWVVPHFAQGGILSVLHQNEMVLPAHISEGLQTMIAGASGGHTFNLNISAWDGRSVMNAGPQIVAAINRAVRNGAMLYQPT